MKKESKSLTLSDVANIHNTTYGNMTCVSGSEARDSSRRLQTGIFSVDLAIGGGIPLNQITIFRGPESGGKTSSAINAVEVAGKMCWRCMKLQCTCSEPSMSMKAFWADVEGTFDKSWAEAIGAAPDSYIVAYGDEGEQYVDMVITAIRASDCGLVVVDSIAALTPSKVMEGSAYNQYMGVGPRFATTFVQRLRTGLTREMKLGHPVACILTNQVRYKLGEMFGNPETMSGGMALKHECSLGVRFAKRSPTEAEKKLRDDRRDINRVQRHSIIVDKLKMQIYSEAGEFTRCREDIKHDDGSNMFRKGEILDYKTVVRYAKEFGLLVGEGTKFRIGEVVGTQKEIIEKWRENRCLYLDTQRAIIEAAQASIGKCHE